MSLSICISVYQSVYQSIYQYVYLSIYLYIYIYIKELGGIGSLDEALMLGWGVELVRAANNLTSEVNIQ